MKFYNLGNLPAKKDLLSLLPDMLSLHLHTPCGGRGSCGKCRLTVRGAVLPPSDRERALLSPEELRRGVRLACLCVTAGGEVEIGIEEAGAASVQQTGTLPAFTLSPVTDAPYALAVDIGTTTVALYLCDCRAGRIVFSDGFENPQKRYGADVITRISAGMEQPALYAEMKRLLIDALNASLQSCGADAAQIGSAVLTGNPTMLHFLAGLDPRGIAVSPYTPASLFDCALSAEELGLQIAPGAPCFLPPCFSAYVGADIATGLVAADCDREEGVALYLDVGTNGEMGLRTPEGILLCATATGPAFEGAHIACGMSGLPGAISHIHLLDGKPVCEVIGGGKPIGICGSALIDAGAALLESGVIDDSGYLEEDPYPLCEDGSVYLCGRDIRELQLAKAAVRGGIETLLAESGYAARDIERVYLAGGFGSHILGASVCRIGMLPPELEPKIRFCGNTAGMGAVLYALSADARNRIHALPGLCRYLELSGNETFMDAYIEHMAFDEE